jgi:NADP-dependent 3-hydroxy acid dehydrogenase YdfG
MSNLAGCVAVVTGAGRGLGAALAIALADAGCRMVLCGRDANALGETAASVKTRGGRDSDVVVLDLADAKSVALAVGAIEGRHPTVDILVNSGAMWLEGRSEHYSADEVAGVIGSAVVGTFLLTQGLLPLLHASPRPDILTIGSTSGLPNAALQNVSVPFYAAKRAQTALVDGFQQQLAGTSVRSMIINPPDLDDMSPMEPAWEASPERKKGQRATNRDIVEAAIFALTRPRHVTLSITVDAAAGGVFS